MDGDTNITLAFAVMLLGALATVWWRLEGMFSEEREARLDLAFELAEYKLHVAQTHVTSTALRETEIRLVTAFEKVASRLEAIVARFDKLSLDLAKAGMAIDQGE